MEPKKSNQKTAEDAFFKLLRQGTAALQQGKTSKAMALLEQAYQLDKENSDLILNLGGAYILSKKFKKAVTILEPLSKRTPHNPMVWTNLGAAYLGNPVLAKPEHQLQAIAAFKQALVLNPATPNIAYNLGLIYIDRNENDKALTWFKKAIQANPNDQDARRYINQLNQIAAQKDKG